SEDSICLHVETTQSMVRVAQAARTRLHAAERELDVPRSMVEEPGFVGQLMSVDLREGVPVVVDKIVTLFTSRDPAISEPGLEACELVHTLRGDFEELLERHVVAWRHLWDRAHIELGIDGRVTRLVHLHKFHALQTVSLHSVSLDV